MQQPNAYKAEVSLSWGETGDRIILRLTYPEIGGIARLVFAAPPAVAENRRKWLGIYLLQRGEQAVPPLDRMEWFHHLIGLIAASEVDTIAKAVAVMAARHQPHIDAEAVMEESPKLGPLLQVVSEAVVLSHWMPGQAPEVAREDRAPFDRRRWWHTLTKWQRSTALPQASSGS